MCTTEQLLELVYANPVLYDLNDKSYKDIKKKEYAWQRISDETDTPESELKKKWKNLRDTYSKYLKGAKTTGKNKKKHRPWRWASEMDRFKPYLSFSQSLENDDSQDNINWEATYAYAGNTDERELAPVVAEVASACSEPKKIKRETDKCTDTDSVVRYFEKINSQQQNIDAVDHLMLSYAKIIKQFSWRGQVKVKSMIAKVIADQELEEIDLLEQGSSLTQ